MFILCAAVVPPPTQAAPQDDVRATVQRFVDAMNTGDFAGALSVCGTATIVDQMAPYVFTGPDGCQRWIRAVTASLQTAGVTGLNATMEPTTSVEVGDGIAYIVSPLKFAVTMKGDRAVKNAVGTFVLSRGPDGWKFSHVTMARPSFTT